MNHKLPVCRVDHSLNLAFIQLSEMTADLTEEQNASTIATERLETEQVNVQRDVTMSSSAFT